MSQNEILLNYVNNRWQRSQAAEQLPVNNPATAEIMARVPLSPAEEVDEAVGGGYNAREKLGRPPRTERHQDRF